MRTSVHAKSLKFIAAAFWVLATSTPTLAAALIANGGFESGFTGWTRVDALGGDGTFFVQSGTASPVNGDPVPAPPGGLNAAMTDAQGPGSHVLYQDFVVPASFGNASLSFDLFIGNRADQFASPATLDFNVAAFNQQARVDVLAAGADPFSVAAADVLLNLYQTDPGDPLVSGYDPIATDLTALLLAHQGETLRLRFAETDNVFTFQFGVDNVSLATVPVPEPSSLFLLAMGFGGLVASRRRKP